MSCDGTSVALKEESEVKRCASAARGYLFGGRTILLLNDPNFCLSDWFTSHKMLKLFFG